MARKRKLGADAGWAAMRISESLVRTRGTGYALGLGRAVGRLLWLVPGRRRRLSLRNAAVALADRTDGERRRAVREAVLESLSYFPEAVSYAYRGPSRVLRNVTVEGREHLDAALAGGRGAVVPTIHLGNFALMGMWMTQAGYDFHFLSRFPHDERIVRFLARLRRMAGVKLIRDLPRRACLEESRAALARNGMICFQLDQRAMQSHPGVDVTFFGRPYRAFGGMVSLALKTGAALVPMYIVRERGVRQRLVVEPAFEPPGTGDRRSDVKECVQGLMHRFEGWIRAHPEHWWWPTRRWADV